MGPAALGGRFTTVEGLIDAMKEQLADRGSMMFSDIAPGTDEKLNTFLAEIDTILAGKRPITLVFDDPAGNSYVQVYKICLGDKDIEFYHIFKI